jgi:hypothetical protein
VALDPKAHLLGERRDEGVENGSRRARGSDDGRRTSQDRTCALNARAILRLDRQRVKDVEGQQ